MDENNKTKLYEEKLAALPEDLKDAFFSDTVTEVILAIGKSHGLTIDKVGELGDEVGLVMLGITPTGDFIRNLSARLVIDKEKAKAIAEDVNVKVFQQIRASLRKVHGLPEAGGEKIAVKKPVPQMPTPAAEIPKAPVEEKPGEIRQSPPIFAKNIVPIDELLDKIDSGESIIKPKAKIESAPPPAEPPSSIRTMFSAVKSVISEAKKSEPPVNLPIASEPNAQILGGLAQGDGPSRAILQQENMRAGTKSDAKASESISTEANLTPEEIKAAVEKALGGKITTPPAESSKDTEAVKPAENPAEIQIPKPAAPPQAPPSPPPIPQKPPVNITRTNDPYREPTE